MGDERWVNVQPPTVDEAQRWLREHGAAFRQDTTDSLLDGNDVALHWAAKVLAALDHIEVLSAEIDSLRATLAAEKVEGERARALIDQAETAFAGVAPYFTGDAERCSEGMALLREALVALSPPSPTEEA